MAEVPASATAPHVAYRLYGELACWWPLISPWQEYQADALHIRGVLDAVHPQARSLLDLGSGGGGVARHLKRRYALSLLDLSVEMLAVSAELNPECEHIRGDIRTARLGRLFDVVLVHDAVDYMMSRRELRLVIETAFAHCRPGGIALFMPDRVTETFVSSTGCGGGDDDDTGRSARFLGWTWDPDPLDSWVQTDYVFMLRSTDGSLEVVRETHRTGLFDVRTWRRLLSDVGFMTLAAPDPAAPDPAAPDPAAPDPAAPDPAAPDPVKAAAGAADESDRRILFCGRRPGPCGAPTVSSAACAEKPRL